MLLHTPDLGDFTDMETMQFVDPYEINPMANTTLQSAGITQQVSVNPDYIIAQKDDITQNKLKMEEFSDLSAFLSAVPSIDITGSIDELSTPVFDKEAFDFAQPTSVENDQGDLKVKVEYNAQYYSSGKHIHTDLTLATGNHMNPKGSSSYSISGVGRETNDMYLYQPLAHSLSYKGKTTSNNVYNPPPDQGADFLEKMMGFDDIPFNTTSNLGLNNNIKDSNSTAASPQDDRYSYISSPADDQLSVPEHYDHPYDFKPKLTLITEQFRSPIKDKGLLALNTPDVIEEVVKMGDDFNILDLVNNEDMSIVSADEELLSTLTSPSALSSEPSTPSVVASKPSSPAKKPSRRRKHSEDDDDDEDYVPPTKKRTSTTRSEYIDNSSDDDDDSYDHRKPTRKARGRPPKRGDSVSSDGSKDLDVSKYRELRDKNNEASRKSRQKRKMKELEYEREAQELHTKNIRLKTQVEELEKMVSNFRNNLFKIVVPK